MHIVSILDYLIHTYYKNITSIKNLDNFGINSNIKIKSFKILHNKKKIILNNYIIYGKIIPIKAIKKSGEFIKLKLINKIWLNNDYHLFYLLLLLLL